MSEDALASARVGLSAAPPSSAGSSTPDSSPPGRRESATSTVTVLVAGDRREARTSLTEMLGRKGYRALPAQSAPAAFDLFVRDRPQVAIVHYDLIDSGDGQLVRRMRALAPAVPIIVETGTLDPQARRDVIRALDVNAIAHTGNDPERMLELVDCALAAARCCERVRVEQEARGLILAKLCHDLRSPLHVLQGYTEVLRGDPRARACEDVLARMAGSIEAAVALVQDYLDLARLDAPGMIVRREREAIDDLIEELRDLAVRRIGNRPLRLTISVPSPGAFIYTDGEKLRAILAQLLANAIKFTPAGDILLAVRFDADRTEFAVTDNGPGIDDDDVPMLFLPFRQEADDSLASTPGQGIGLAIALRLTVLIGGRLTAGRGRDGGATFTLTLPGSAGVESTERSDRILH